MGSSKAQLMHRIPWEVTKCLTDVETWLHEREMWETAASQRSLMGDAMTFTVKRHPNLYLDIQSCSGVSAKKQVAPHVHKNNLLP